MTEEQQIALISELNTLYRLLDASLPLIVKALSQGAPLNEQRRFWVHLDELEQMVDIEFLDDECQPYRDGDAYIWSRLDKLNEMEFELADEIKAAEEEAVTGVQR